MEYRLYPAKTILSALLVPLFLGELFPESDAAFVAEPAANEGGTFAGLLTRGATAAATAAEGAGDATARRAIRARWCRVNSRSTSRAIYRPAEETDDPIWCDAPTIFATSNRQRRNKIDRQRNEADSSLACMPQERLEDSNSESGCCRGGKC